MISSCCWRTHLEKPIGAKRLTALTTSDVRALHRKASEKRTVAVKLKTGTEIQTTVRAVRTPRTVLCKL